MINASWSHLIILQSLAQDVWFLTAIIKHSTLFCCCCVCVTPLDSLKDKPLFHCQPAVTVVTVSGHMTLIFCLPNTPSELCWSCRCLIPSVVPFLDNACSYQVSTELKVFGELDIKLDYGSKYSTKNAIYHTAGKFVTEGFVPYQPVYVWKKKKWWCTINSCIRLWANIKASYL